MKSLYQGIADVLLNDADLRSFVMYTDKEKNIRRGYVPPQGEGRWNRMLIFHLDEEQVGTDFTPKIRQVPLIIRVYDRESDLGCDDIAERAILLLDGADLSVAGETYVYDCSYAGELYPSWWNDDLKSYEKVLRFVVIFRVDGVVGSSGVPTRKRKQER